MHPSQPLAGLLLGVAVAGGAAALPTALPDGQPDVLFVLVDDLGIDQLPNVYAQSCTDPNPAKTPNIDLLAANGVTFDNFHVYPSCSPTRAALISGLEPIKPGNGIGQIVRDGDPAGFELTTPTIFRQLSDNHGYSVGVIGKWHLTPKNDPEGDFDTDFGAKIGADIVDVMVANHANRDYYDFRTFDGAAWVDHKATYSPRWITDRAMQCWDDLASPKLAYVSYTAVHEPWHTALPWWNESDWSDFDPKLDPRSAQKSMLEALDLFLGELLFHVGPDTTVVFLSDNGTPEAASDHCTTPELQGKGTLYEGGIRVPAIIRSPLFTPGTRADGFVMAIDVFPTLVELAGGDPNQVPMGYDYDFFSFLDHAIDPVQNPSQRTLIFSESFSPNRVPAPVPSNFNQKTVISDDGYKYILNISAANMEELYLLPDESNNLIGSIVPGSEADLALQFLRQAMADYRVYEL